jgi:eukaryotic-like serine/threonine-protein kinase
MELVRGIKITDYCDQNNLSTNERLELFIQVCQAIQHAHQKGIIHRDIKPSNILVAQHDDVAVPKVIDFGIAKATTGQLTDKTLFTAFAQFIGTPAYMSPEQAQLSGLDIDTRADIYSLGVLLYELLTGQTPFDQKELLAVGLDEMRRIIREKEPPKPSTRLTQELSAFADEQRKVRKWGSEKVGGDARSPSDSHSPTFPPAHFQAGFPRTAQEVHRLIPLLRGDLDWLVMKCLEKDRTRRYETANALAMDLQRHLNNEPVVACPPSNLYRIQKMVRRNRLAVASATAVGMALIIGLGLSTWLFVRERAALKVAAENASHAEQQAQQAELSRQQAEANEKKATAEAVKSQQVAQFLKDMLQSVHPSVALGRDTTMLREILDKTAERVSNDLKDQPEVQAELLTILGLTYTPIAHDNSPEALHREALRLRRKLFGETNETVAASLNHLGRLLILGSAFGEAEMLSRQSLAINRTLHGNEHPDVALSLYVLASALQGQRKSADAEILHREALAMRKKLLGDHVDVAFSLNNLALVLHAQNHRNEEAEAMICEALSVQRKLFGNDYPDVAVSLRNLSVVLQAQGRLADAEHAAREGYVIRQKIFGSGSGNTRFMLDRVAELLRLQGKPAETENLFRDEITRLKSQFGGEHREVAAALHNFAYHLRASDKIAEAEIVAQEALAMRRKLQGSEHPDVAEMLGELSNLLRRQNKLEEAESTARENLAICRKLFGSRSLNVSQRLYSDEVALAGSLATLVHVLLMQEKFVEAESFARECLNIREKRPDDWLTFNTRSLLGASLLGQEKYAEAEPLLLSGYEGMEQRESVIWPISKIRIKEAIERLVQFYQATANLDKAAEWKTKLAEFDNPEAGQ